jgi:hypothetical protein
LKKFLTWLGKEIYLGFVPVDPALSRGAENYLVDLWAQAPRSVAVIHTTLALIVWMLPIVVLKRPVLFHQLSTPDQEKMIRRMKTSRIYLIRLIAYGVKGHALVAVFREPSARRQLLQPVAPTPVEMSA